MGDGRRSDLLLLVLCQFVWGAGWTALKLAQQQMGPVILNVWALAISEITLLPLLLYDIRTNSNPDSKQHRSAMADFMMAGVVGLGGMTLLYALGTGRSSAASGALISMCVPVWTTVIAAIVLAERFTLKRAASLGAAVGGAVLVSDIRFGELEVLGSQAVGNGLLLAGAVANAVYVVYSKKLLEASTPIRVLFWTQLAGLALSLPFIQCERPLSSPVEYSAATWGSLIFIGLVYFTVSMVVFFRILTRLGAGQIMVSTYLQPVFGVLTATTVLGERITTPMIAGGVLVLAATALATAE